MAIKKKQVYESESEDDFNNDYMIQEELDDQVDSEEEFDEEEDEEVESDDGEEEEEEVPNEALKAAQLAKIKRDLAHVSFEQLAEVKGKMGEKGFEPKKKVDKSQILKDLQGAVGKVKKTNKVKLSKDDMKRDNKHKPMEMSSKRAVGRFRQVVDIQAEKRRDPRFDKLSGSFNQDLFEKSYGFLEGYKKSEMEMLKERIKKEKDPDEKEQMNELLKKMISAEKQQQEKKRKQALLKEHKQKEAELVKQGKTPYFLKRSEKRKLDLMDKYEKLGAKTVDRILEKRRKKNSAKDRKHLPFNKRRSAD